MTAPSSPGQLKSHHSPVEYVYVVSDMGVETSCVKNYIFVFTCISLNMFVSILSFLKTISCPSLVKSHCPACWVCFLSYFLYLFAASVTTFCVVAAAMGEMISPLIVSNVCYLNSIDVYSLLYIYSIFCP